MPRKRSKKNQLKSFNATDIEESNIHTSYESGTAPLNLFSCKKDKSKPTPLKKKTPGTNDNILKNLNSLTLSMTNSLSNKTFKPLYTKDKKERSNKEVSESTYTLLEETNKHSLFLLVQANPKDVRSWQSLLSSSKETDSWEYTMSLFSKALEHNPLHTSLWKLFFSFIRTRLGSFKNVFGGNLFIFEKTFISQNEGNDKNSELIKFFKETENIFLKSLNFLKTDLILKNYLAETEPIEKFKADVYDLIYKEAILEEIRVHYYNLENDFRDEYNKVFGHSANRNNNMEEGWKDFVCISSVNNQLITFSNYDQTDNGTALISESEYFTRVNGIIYKNIEHLSNLKNIFEKEILSSTINYNLYKRISVASKGLEVCKSEEFVLMYHYNIQKITFKLKELTSRESFAESPLSEKNKNPFYKSSFKLGFINTVLFSLKSSEVFPLREIINDYGCIFLRTHNFFDFIETIFKLLLMNKDTKTILRRVLVVFFGFEFLFTELVRGLEGLTYESKETLLQDWLNRDDIIKSYEIFQNKKRNLQIGRNKNFNLIYNKFCNLIELTRNKNAQKNPNVLKTLSSEIDLYTVNTFKTEKSWITDGLGALEVRLENLIEKLQIARNLKV